MYKTFNIKRVMYWRLIIEEFSPELIYIKGEHNVVADALSHLDLSSEPIKQDINVIAEDFGLDKHDFKNFTYPLKYSVIEPRRTQTKSS